jgi:hypothetical protein
MKCKNIFFVVICVLVGLFSCKSGSAQKGEFRLRSFNRTVRLIPSRPNKSPRMNFELELFDAGKNEFFNDFLYSGKSSGQYADELIRDFAEMYAENREFAESQIPAPASFNWEYIERMSFSRQKERGMLITRENYVFTGGAHGMGTKKYYVIDLAGEKLLYLEDFFSDIYSDRLREIVFDELRRYSAENGLVIAEGRPLSEGLFLTDDPAISRNFFVNSEGLRLNWDPIEIAPYFAGSIEILLPWKLIRPLLRHDAMELLEKFGYYQFM